MKKNFLKDSLIKKIKKKRVLVDLISSLLTISLTIPNKIIRKVSINLSIFYPLRTLEAGLARDNCELGSK